MKLDQYLGIKPLEKTSELTQAEYFALLYPKKNKRKKK